MCRGGEEKIEKQDKADGQRRRNRLVEKMVN